MCMLTVTAVAATARAVTVTVVEAALAILIQMWQTADPVGTGLSEGAVCLGIILI